MAQFSLYVYKGGLKPHLFHLHLGPNKLCHNCSVVSAPWEDAGCRLSMVKPAVFVNWCGLKQSTILGP